MTHAAVVARRRHATPPLRDAATNHGTAVTKRSDDDPALWHQVTRDVRRLENRRARTDAKVNRHSDPEDEGPRRPHIHHSPVPRPTVPPRSAWAGRDLEVGAIDGVDRKTFDRLRKGRLPVDAVLDLHGDTQAVAHRRLHSFIARCRMANSRCVLIVTGKGSVSQGGGVLRKMLPEWLNGQDMRPHVVAISQAQQQHGGVGAYYVLLRRNRPPRD